MPIDPNIPLAATQGTGFMETLGGGLRLSGAIQEQKQYQEQQADNATLQDYLRGGGNFGTAQGMLKASEELRGKISPSAYQKLVQNSEQMKMNEAQAEREMALKDRSELESGLQRTNFVAQQLETPIQEYKRIQESQGQQAADAAWPQLVQRQAQAVSAMRGPNGQPVIDPNMVQRFMQMNPREAETALQNTTYWRDKQKDILDLKYREEQIAKEQAATEWYKRRPAGGAAAAPTMSGKAIDMVAERVIAGDPHALTNLGRGAQGAANISAIENRVAQLGEERGMSGADIARHMTELKGMQAGLTALGQRQAKLDTVALEVDKFADNVSTGMDKVSRGNIVPVNEIIRRVELGTGSPEEAEFATYMRSLSSAYASALSRGGPVTVYAQREAQRLLNQSYSKPQLKATISALKKETEGIISSSKEAARSIEETAYGRKEPAEKTAATPRQVPKAGDVVKGHKFKGGNPNDPKNWEKA